MMVMMCTLAEMADYAVFFGAELARLFKLNCGVAYAVLTELFSDFFFDYVSRSVCDNVHCGVVVLRVNASDVNMVDIGNAVDFFYVLFYFGNRYALRSFFEKKIYYASEIFKCVYQYEYGHTY